MSVCLSALCQSFNPAIIDPNNNDIRWNNTNLDDSQKDGVRFALKQRELAIIHGPPGTGKTTTIVELIVQATRCGDKILVCAPSNIAVDNLLQRLVAEKVRCVRLGHPARITGDLHRYSLDAQVSTSDQSQVVRDVYKEIDDILSKNKNKKDGRGFREIKALRKELREREKKVLKEILSNAQVILGTLASSGADSPLKHLPENHFSMTVIDECSQSLEMACWMVVGWAPKLVLAGDHLQLPPTILSTKASKELELTLMERQINLHGGQSVVRMLTTQYRMNAAIMTWSSDALYEGRVRAGDSVARHTLADLPDVQRNELTETVLLLVDTCGANMVEFSTMDGISKGNEGEASLVVHQVTELLEAGVKQQDIGIITPYNLQVETIRMNLHPRYPKIEVNSVDGFQGREKEVILISLVRSNPGHEVGFLAERRRLNVAVTRARRQVVVIGDSETVGTDKFLAELFEYMTEHGRVETAEMYADLPQVDRPEDTTLAATAASITNSTSSKSSTTSAKASTKSAKQPSKKSTETKHKPLEVKKENIKIEDNCNKADDTNIDNDTNNITEEQRKEELKEKFTKILEDFIASDEVQLDMSPKMNSFERMLMHEVAESFNFIHQSIGEGKDRHIVIKKKNADKTVVKASTVIKSIKTTSGAVNKPKNTPKEPTTSDKKINSIAIDVVTCCICQKEIPKCNIELHKLRCAPPKVVLPPPAKNNEKSKKSKAKEPEEDDFDAICGQFEKLNKICNYDGCKTKITIIGANCQFCRVRFCLSHSMAEIHGCGDAARTAARAQLVRDGKIYPGSGTPSTKTLDPVKRVHVQRKLDKKLASMAEGRKPKDSSKDKKK